MHPSFKLGRPPAAARLSGFRLAQQRRRVKCPAKTASKSAAKPPETATEAVEQGLQLFSEGQTEDALRLFSAVAGLQPRQEELRAAEYNRACALVKLKRWPEAQEAIIAAVNEHGEDLQTALKAREWAAACETTC